MYSTHDSYLYTIAALVEEINSGPTNPHPWGIKMLTIPLHFPQALPMQVGGGGHIIDRCIVLKHVALHYNPCSRRACHRLGSTTVVTTDFICGWNKKHH